MQLPENHDFFANSEKVIKIRKIGDFPIFHWM